MPNKEVINSKSVMADYSRLHNTVNGAVKQLPARLISTESAYLLSFDEAEAVPTSITESVLYISTSSNVKDMQQLANAAAIKVSQNSTTVLKQLIKEATK